MHLWISLINEKINKSCMNYRITRIFNSHQVNFYGDYDLDIFIGTKHDYHSLINLLDKVIITSSGWIRYIKSQNCELNFSKDKFKNLSDILNDIGNVSSSDKLFHKIFPKKENGNIHDIIITRYDGNFKMFACETDTFYYVICFATS